MFEIARMDYTQYRKHFFPKQQDGWDILSCCFASPLPPQRCPARLFIDDNCRPRSAAVGMRDFCSQFTCWEDYARWGCGFLLTKEGRPLSGASSYLVSESGFTIQVQTEDSQQGRGYAKFPSAALIAAALEQGIYPDWDADNEASARLAQRLGYQLEGSYETILVQQRV